MSLWRIEMRVTHTIDVFRILHDVCNILSYDFICPSLEYSDAGRKGNGFCAVYISQLCQGSSTGCALCNFPNYY
ncbi:hypothetical protein IEQ34_018472 [Dendrobium chrysotoxum]|uniref:Uncharacterized protein n=1 Tax=Dendrobium chrysotoxum TaxID=161865 RepID=A0AAV7G742_DENCH|nr:hypothetical protein IEQ34_018472 [Dendrobium chrysotoxum]